jgi:hypothetical protein
MSSCSRRESGRGDEGVCDPDCSEGAESRSRVTKPREQAEVRLTAWPTQCRMSLWLPSATLNKRSPLGADRLQRKGFADEHLPVACPQRAVVVPMATAKNPAP